MGLWIGGGPDDLTKTQKKAFVAKVVMEPLMDLEAQKRTTPVGEDQLNKKPKGVVAALKQLKNIERQF